MKRTRTTIIIFSLLALAVVLAITPLAAQESTPTATPTATPSATPEATLQPAQAATGITSATVVHSGLNQVTITYATSRQANEVWVFKQRTTANVTEQYNVGFFSNVLPGTVNTVVYPVPGVPNDYTLFHKVGDTYIIQFYFRDNTGNVAKIDEHVITPAQRFWYQIFPVVAR